MVMDVDDIQVMCAGQGHRSKVKVTISKNVIFKDFTQCIRHVASRFKVTRVKVKGNLVQGQRSRS